jgi:hypothetical protein
MRLILSYSSFIMLACSGLWHAGGLEAHAQDWDRMGPMVPRSYVCYRAETPILIDGRLTDPAWRHAPWTEPFNDIRGSQWPDPTFRTRARLLWDNEYLYIGALLEEPHVWGTLTERNAIIFYDNDFEIFIDPDGDNHNYYEFEVNALNTIWELTLTKPYKDGGPATHGTNIAGLRSAVFVDGSLNAPFDTDQYWSVEVAIPWAGLSRYNEGNTPPSEGDRWRINFSRVEWQHEIVDGAYRKVPDTPEDNWVWSPQGIVDMHRPERWGFVQFSSQTPGTDSFEPDPTLAARDMAMQVYHAQKTFKESAERWARDLAELGLAALGDRGRYPRVVRMSVADDTFEVEVTDSLPSGRVVRVFTDHESRIRTESE